MIRSNTTHRSEAAIAAVLPLSVQIERGRDQGYAIDLKINGQMIRAEWLGEGGLRQARELIAKPTQHPDVAVARRMSPGAREALSVAGVGWVDETGAAEIVLESLIVSKSGHQIKKPQRLPHWTPAVLAVAEALLCDGRPTVSAMQEVTKLSAGSVTNALRTLMDLGLISAVAYRGRNSARRIDDKDRLLDAYATAAAAMMPEPALTVGVTWREPTEILAEVGQRWDNAGITWAATGIAAASVLAPYLTTVNSGDVYVGRRTVAELEAIAAIAELKPINDGRLTLRPFPTVTARLLSVVKNGLSFAPWPRVYADLRISGVRGEEAAEHLREVINDLPSRSRTARVAV